MKNSKTFQGFLSLATSVALVVFWPAASVQSGAASQPPAAITLLDANGDVVPPNAPTAVAQIIDVVVGPNGQRVFSPSTVNVSVGDTVRWTWASNDHNVVSGASCSPNSQFCSPTNMNCNGAVLSDAGTVYSHTFTQPGSFSYFCSAHCGGGMIGSVNVTAACTTPPAGMVGWWPGDGSARDIRGRNGGAIEGNVTFAAGRVGQAFRLGGNGDRVLVGRAPSLQLQDFTIDAWVKRGSATVVTNNPDPNSPGGTFFAYGQGGYGFAIDQPTGRLLLTQIGVSGAFSVRTITDTNYHHVAVTKQGSTVTFYIDGVADASISYNPTFTFTSGAAIGARGDGSVLNSFFGDIDELEIFNRALSASEIQAIFNAGALGKCKAPQPTAAVSRRTHGAGPLDLDLTPNTVAGIECRNTGGVYQLVVQFPNPVTVSGATFSGTGSVTGTSVSGSTVTIDLNMVTSPQSALLMLNGVSDGTLSGDVPIAVNFLIGDTNGDGTVNAADALQTRGRSGQVAATNNFRSDVNTDGVINSADALAVRSRSGTSLSSAALPPEDGF
jgi:plastocyanin